MPFSTAVLAVSSFTVSTTVAAFSAAVPPLVISSVLLAPSPLTEAPALAALALTVSLAPPATTLCVAAPR